MVYTIEEIQEKIFPVARKYRIPAVWVFGSYARGEATEDSDIDLLVDTTGTTLTSLFSLGALYCDLEDTLGKKIDLITVGSLQQPERMPSDRGFRERVQRERVRIFAVA
ncbi:MAG: nucleotidyltransferase family protein [Clostridia bacterium]|nr:nucleotidyltransferase family protein [Clostridia bacterium]